MYRDSKVCEASCDCETKLYYLPTSSSDVAHMTSLSGLSYKSLETAFQYRKEWSEDCTCRPAPWSVAERERHSEYQDEAREAAEKSERKRLEQLARNELFAMKKNEPQEPVVAEVPLRLATIAEPAQEPTSTEAGFEVMPVTEATELTQSTLQVEELMAAPSSLTPIPEESALSATSAPERSRAAAQGPRAKRTARQARPASKRAQRPVSRGLFQL